MGLTRALEYFYVYLDGQLKAGRMGDAGTINVPISVVGLTPGAHTLQILVLTR